MKKKYILVLMVIFCLVLAGCGSQEEEKVETSGYDLTYSERDLDPSYNKASAEKITLANEDVVISEEGTYILTGTMTDGQIIVETDREEKVQLVLNGVTLACSDDAPIYIKETDKVFVTLADGSTNTVTGPESFSSAEAAEEGTDGAIYSKSDMCFNGSGSLTVTSSGHGIVSKDDLIFTGGTYTVSAEGDGLQGKDCVKINDGTFNITCSNDGIRSSNDEEEYRGFVSVNGGTFTITAGYDGIQAATLVRCAGGSFDITTGGGSGNASTQSSWQAGWGQGPGGGHGGGMGPQSQTSTETEDTEDEASAKGIKSGLELIICGGTFNLDSSDDAIHCNGDASIEAGTISIASGDDGVHADGQLKISDGEITVTKSYEGLEAGAIIIKDGTINVTASDDGLNAAGGSDGSSTEDRPGGNSFESGGDQYIKISGGKLTIHANGDGVDSNGDLEITGGEIVVSCPVSGDTSVLDYSGEGTISSGAFVGTGAEQMAQSFGVSEQGVIAVSAGNQSAGSTIVITDSQGNEILNYTPDQAYAVVIVSLPEIKAGETYTINAGGVTGEITAS